MAEPTAPVTAEDLREPLQIAKPRELVGRLVRQVWVEWAHQQDAPKPSWLLPWEDLDDGQREVDMRIGAALFDAGRNAGSAALAGDPGDLPARMADAIAAYWESDEAIYDGFEVAKAAAAAMSVRWEHAAWLAAENDYLRRRAEHAEGQLSARRDHETRWELERQRANGAEAEVDRLLAELEEAQIEIASWRLARSQLGRWWEWPLVQWWWYRQYKRRDRKAFKRECEEIRDRAARGDQ